MAKLSGPLFDPKHEGAFRARLLAAMKSEGRATEGAVVDATPVGGGRKGHKGGALKESIRVRTTGAKRRITIAVTASAANPKGFPYGRAQEAHSGFVSNVLERRAGALMSSLRRAAIAFVEEVNAGANPTGISIGG